MSIETIRADLFTMQDIPYRDFQSKLIPNLPADSMIGVRTPELRKYAKALGKQSDMETFLSDLPHRYFEENQLHAFVLSEVKDFNPCIEAVCRFLPYVDNWATCDQMSPKVFRKHRAELLPYIQIWLASDHPYTVRFGIGMLMQHYLDDAFDPAFPAAVAALQSREYYVNMMRAWYFATALAKQPDAVLPYLTDQKLDAWTHNKTIQKAVESYRIPDAQKDALRRLKRPSIR